MNKNKYVCRQKSPCDSRSLRELCAAYSRAKLSGNRQLMRDLDAQIDRYRA